MTAAASKAAAEVERLLSQGFQLCAAQIVPGTDGQSVWSATLAWGLVSGTMYLELYGVHGGRHGRPVALTVRQAAGNHVCRDCAHVIPRGALYGSTGLGSHYCACCVTATAPASVFLSGRGEIIEPLPRADTAA